MKFIRRSVAVLALLALSFWLWTILFPSPEKIIRRQLAGVAAAASFADNEGLVKQAAKISELIGYFSVDAQITFDAPAHGQLILSGRSEIQELAVAARKTVRSLAVEFLDVDVTLAADKQSATVDLTATAKVPSERNHYVQEMKFVLMKINGKWLIVRAETVKTLSRMEIRLPEEIPPKNTPIETLNLAGARSTIPIILASSWGRGWNAPSVKARAVHGGVRDVST